MKHGSTIVERQLSHWFRLTTERVESEKKTQSRIPTDPLCSALRKAFVHWFGLPEEKLIPIDRRKIVPLRAIKQGVGNLRSALLQMGYVCPEFKDFPELVAIAIDKVYPNAVDKKAFVDAYHRRSSEYAA